MIDCKEVLKLIHNSENEKAEFKTTFKSDAIESIVAFANSKGGVLLIGVSDNGTVVDVDIGKKSVQNSIPSVIPDVEQDKIEYKGSKKTGGYVAK